MGGEETLRPGFGREEVVGGEDREGLCDVRGRSSGGEEDVLTMMLLDLLPWSDAAYEQLGLDGPRKSVVLLLVLTMFATVASSVWASVSVSVCTSVVAVVLLSSHYGVVSPQLNETLALTVSGSHALSRLCSICTVRRRRPRMRTLTSAAVKYHSMSVSTVRLLSAL